ncbi:Msh3 [Cyberlindnera jadinii]|uniref:DNA mismatch repair protein MSH3 n=2 Tax=Cyberlindnera jadinii (strain ATCC 18201 / CBS 1600 / BCRC 20928 / JCM 3617 / NBRC 0987 / NRRL Y-1542) TaxID=983966 RepID=A0A0H5C328_CYBJN|nr:Msh3 [Cyberlindnera jadinii]
MPSLGSACPGFELFSTDEMKGTVRKVQPSISQFFSPSRKRQQTRPTSSSNDDVTVVVLDDDEGKSDVAETVVAETVIAKTAVDKACNVDQTDRVRRFGYDKAYTGKEPSKEVTAVRERFRKTLSQRVFDRQSSKMDEDGDEIDDEDNDSFPVQPATKRTKKSKLTPLDEQVKELKLQHMDKVLAIQVGYKYKFFCQDAVRVHKILNIMLVPGKLNLINETAADMLYHKLAYCSIPENRLHIHLQRLLDKGLKVGIVDQAEASAVKTLDDSRPASSLFKRKLSKVFTKATYIEYDEKNSGVKDDRAVDSLMSIIEHNSSDGKLHITIVTVQPLTGEIIYDEFEADFLRNELNTRLHHLEPIEILYFEDSLSELTIQTLDAFVRQNSSTNIRKTTFPLLKKTYYDVYMNNYVSQWPQLFDFMSSKSPQFQIATALLLDYLREFDLDAAFHIEENYKNFQDHTHMKLNALTLQNLELFQNSTNGEEYGSLLWLMNHTRTKFGFRLLRKWISQPLVQREQIEQRLDAIGNIHDSYNHFLESFASLLKNCPDLEKILNRIHYGKVGHKELYVFLNKLNEFNNLITKFGRFDILTGLHSPLLKTLFSNMIQLCLDLEINQVLNMIHSPSALSEDPDERILTYFVLENLTINHDSVLQEQAEIKNIEKSFEQELKDCSTILKKPHLQYVTKSKEPYLIEVHNANLKKVPKEWIKISSTKLVSRFRTPTTNKLYKEQLYHRELYKQACCDVFDEFTSEVDRHYTQLSKFIRCLSEYDCILSLAATSSVTGFTKPVFVDERIVRIHQGRNPIVEHFSNFVSNSTNLSPQCQCSIVTGPNMGGKSSYVKQIALIIIMAQIGCYVPAESSTLGIFSTILTRMGAQDDLLKGESTFFTEMSQMMSILNEMSVKGNKLVILDELGRGTGTADGIALAEAILEYILQEENDTLTLFITHFPSICKLSEKYSGVQNFHMGYIEERSKEGDWPKVTFLYNLVEGMAKNSYGLNVAKLAGVDDVLIQRAFEISETRRVQVEQHQSFKETLAVRDEFQRVTQGEGELKSVMRLKKYIDEC